MNLRWLKQNLFTLIGTVVFAIVLAAIIWQERSAAADKARIESDLEQQETQLTGLRSKDPAPSTENIEAYRRQREQVQKLYQDLQRGAVREPINVPALQRPIDFSQLLRDTVARLTGQANANRIKTPPNFLFGFSRYDTDFPCRQAGVSADDCRKTLALLAKQLLVVEKFGGLLMDSHVEEITHVRRTEVEPGTASTDALAVPISADPKGLYQTYPFELEFIANTQSLRNFLNSLAKSDWFFAVRTVKIESASATTSTGGSGGSATVTDSSIPAEPTRTIERRHLNVTVRIDLVEFTPPPAKTGAK